MVPAGPWPVTVIMGCSLTHWFFAFLASSGCLAFGVGAGPGGGPQLVQFFLRLLYQIYDYLFPKLHTLGLPEVSLALQSYLPLGLTVDTSVAFPG